MLDKFYRKLSENGKMYIEYSEQQSVPNYPQDPLHASAAEIKQLLQEQGLVIVGEITKDVKANSLAVERSIQMSVKNWSKRKKK